MTRVAIRSLSKTWPGAARPVVDGLTLDLACGGLTALLGPSGCGKTTVMKIVAGLLDATSGEVLFDDRPVLGEPADARGAVMVFQNALLFPYMTVAQNIGFGLRMRRVPAPEIAVRVGEMLQAVRLPGLGHRKPSELSGGQQQRAALARALILRPRVLLLDEPLSNLDAHLRAEMRDLIRDLQRETGITTLMVTHDQEEAVALADRIALMLEGRIRQEGRPEDFYQHPADLDVARFFGSCNFIAGTAAGGFFRSGIGDLALPADCPFGAGLLTFRPEAMRLGTGPENTLAARVTGLRFLGTQTRIDFDVAGQRLCGQFAPDQARDIAVGQNIPVNLPRASLWVIPDGQSPKTESVG